MGFATGLIAGALLGEASRTSNACQYTYAKTPDEMIWMFAAWPLFVILSSASYGFIKKPTLSSGRAANAFFASMVSGVAWAFLIVVVRGVIYIQQAN